MAKRATKTAAPVTAQPTETATEGAPTTPGANVGIGGKNFRQNTDVEAFYQFVWENDLRYEAHKMITQLLEQKRLRRGVKAARNLAH